MPTSVENLIENFNLSPARSVKWNEIPTTEEEGIYIVSLSNNPEKNNGTNKVTISIIPNKLGHISMIIQLDNLGKGASGAAVQNMNLMLGLNENAGINS